MAALLIFGTCRSSHAQGDDGTVSAGTLKIADRLEALAHFGRVAAKCGDWTDGEDRVLRQRYTDAARKLAVGDQRYALTRYEAGVASANHDFPARPIKECSDLRNQVWMPRLRELEAGQRSFWQWP